MSKIVYITVGHTAAGKTTLSRMLSEIFKIEYISEGKIKRSLKSSYSSFDSLDEHLRNEGYKKAIEQMADVLKTFDSVILDASFHKKYRRQWVYDTLKTITGHKIFVVWFFCECPDNDTVKERISKRKSSCVKHADNQADIYEIYEHISTTFDMPKISEFPSTIPSAIIKINTFSTTIETIEESINFDHSIIIKLQESFLPQYCINVKAM